MRRLRIVGIVAAAVWFTFVGLIAYGSWVSAQMVYPAPENESAFLRGYDPKAVVMPFMANEGYGEGRGSGGGAGMKFVTHNAEFEEYFEMRADQAEAVMDAVGNDVSQQLILSGVRILNQSGTALSGFKFLYTTGKTIGEVSIRPLAPGVVHRNTSLPTELRDVAVNINLREQWFPKRMPTGTVGLLPDENS